MKVRTLTAIFAREGETIPSGVVLDVPTEVAADWIGRKIATAFEPDLEVAAKPEGATPPARPAHPKTPAKGKR